MEKEQLNPEKWRLYESTLIKCIRRGLTDDCIYWSIYLFKIGKQDSVWRRILIHTSEDIGVANENLPATIRALYENYKTLLEMPKDIYDNSSPELKPYVHAIILLAKSQKSRAVDNAINVYLESDEIRTVIDCAYDHHSPLGRRMGRDLKHYLTTAAHLENKSSFEDIWEPILFKNKGII